MLQGAHVLNATLAAAVGDDSNLIDELRQAFFASTAKLIDALGTASDDAEWTNAALRLKGLAASFGALRIMDVAAEAAQGRRDGKMLARITQVVDGFRARA